MHQLDLDTLLYLNHTTAAHPYLVTLVKFLGDNSMGRGLPIVAAVIYLWFSSKSLETRCRILLGLMTTCAMLGISVACQYVLSVHLRPIFDQSIDIANILDWRSDRFQSRHYSFPSDT